LYQFNKKNIQSNKKNVQDILWKPAGNKKKRQQHIKGLGLWCLTPLPTIFQLYHDS
jgi:hypothetical protein